MEDMGIKYQKSKILVTGGAGFIGSNLVKALLGTGVRVFVIDIAINPNSIFTLEKLEKRVSFEKLDIRDENRVFDYFNKFNFDYVFHLAAEPIVEDAFDNPYSSFETNIMGTVNILEAARKNKNIKGIIVASSDKAYGKTIKPYTEDAPLKGDHPYDVSKSCADLISQAYFKTYQLPIVITRFGNVYGEGDTHLNRIVPGICEAIIKKKTLQIRSDGTYTRDYIYVKDVVEGYMFLIKNINKIKGEAFNFSSKDTLSVFDLVKKAERILKKKVPYKILDIARNEIPYQHLDDTKLRKRGWKAKYKLENTLEKVFLWYKHLAE